MAMVRFQWSNLLITKWTESERRVLANATLMEEIALMKKMVRAVTLAVPFVLAAGLASAQEPMSLSDNQLDAVTAGAEAYAFGDATAFGRNIAIAFTQTQARAVRIGSIVSELTTITSTGVESASLSQAFGQ